MVRRMVSIVEDDGIRRPTGLAIDFREEEAVVTFEGLVSDTPFVKKMATLLEVLSSQLGTPVDIEFACDGEDFYLLQCRPQSYSLGGGPCSDPQEPAQERGALFREPVRFQRPGPGYHPYRLCGSGPVCGTSRAEPTPGRRDGR